MAHPDLARLRIAAAIGGEHAGLGAGIDSLEWHVKEADWFVLNWGLFFRNLQIPAIARTIVGI